MLFLIRILKIELISLNALETYIFVESKHIYCSLNVYDWYFIHSAKKNSKYYTCFTLYIQHLFPLKIFQQLLVARLNISL